MFAFRRDLSLEQRQKQVAKFKAKHQDLIPIILEKHEKSQLPLPEKSKFLSPVNLKTTDLVACIRAKLQLPPEMALMLFIEGRHILPAN
jgi:GABA(A) receptor-associated protein